jgi:hypothetical protein
VKKSLKLLDIKRVSKSAAHCAFTDLIENPFDKSRKTLMCCYRQATNHVSADGVLVVSTIDKASFQIRHRVIIRESNADLRDPKFSHDGSRLMLTSYAKTYLDNGKMVTKMMTYFTTTGLSWSGANRHGKSGWWLWNHTWHNSDAYGFAYNRPSNTLSLYKGDPTRTMQLHKEEAFSLGVMLIHSAHNLVRQNRLIPNGAGMIWVFILAALLLWRWVKACILLQEDMSTGTLANLRPKYGSLIA